MRHGSHAALHSTPRPSGTVDSLVLAHAGAAPQWGRPGPAPHAVPAAADLLQHGSFAFIEVDLGSFAFIQVDLGCGRFRLEAPDQNRDFHHSTARLWWYALIQHRGHTAREVGMGHR